jgi:hypothetical protein
VDIGRYSKDPLYGRGVWRRRIRLSSSPGVVNATLDDNHHSMWCRIFHAERRVTAIEAGTIRIPTTACPGAALALRSLEGWSIDTAPDILAGDGRTQLNCTHMIDLGILAIVHARRVLGQRVFDVAVPDETDSPIWIEVRRDGVVVHRWRVRHERIMEPVELAGQGIIKGFTRVAKGHFEDEVLEAALVLHKGYFVGRARAWSSDRQPAQSIAHHRDMLGVCHTYSPAQVDGARTIGHYVLDFTNGVVEANPEQQ